MRTWGTALLIGFTYIGTIVGAGFASGQEILQFFTLYGRAAVFTIMASSLLLLWLGTKVMIIARDIGARSYEDMNVYLFGDKVGRWVSMSMFVLLLAITTVMLAGAGSVFHEHYNVAYQSGLLFTSLLVYAVIAKGINGIKAANSIVVPVMMIFMMFILYMTLQSPAGDHRFAVETDYPMWRIWLSPFMYAAFNLSLAQAVLVPLGSATGDIRAIRLGGLAGGIGITAMLLTGHLVLSAHMPGIIQFDIPMGQVIAPLGPWMQFFFVVLIFAEIFTTLIANVYGMTLQLRQHVEWKPETLTVTLLGFCYAISQIGFKTLLSTLYPLLGFISLIWLAILIVKRRHSG